eukprot:TRINITY_DN66231_c0_g1_i1.p1 TRINITY_DN66231_c0_g1~~TRINITY_DN66231_c0_g1_i1.p1  ORF type:complete len:106 (+),score=5.67 TRINITY_DN66231_c0_g1_i1:377-694(+)
MVTSLEASRKRSSIVVRGVSYGTGAEFSCLRAELNSSIPDEGLNFEDGFCPTPLERPLPPLPLPLSLFKSSPVPPCTFSARERPFVSLLTRYDTASPVCNCLVLT